MSCLVVIQPQIRTRISFYFNSHDLFQRRWPSKASNWIQFDMHEMYVVVAVFNKHDAALSGLTVGWRIQFHRAQIKCIMAHVYTSHYFFWLQSENMWEINISYKSFRGENCVGISLRPPASRLNNMWNKSIAHNLHRLHVGWYQSCQLGLISGKHY